MRFGAAAIAILNALTTIKGFAYSAGARVTSNKDINLLNEYVSQAMLVRHIDDTAQKEPLLRFNSLDPCLPASRRLL
ncbi:MAG: hypothetical protein M3N23_06955 [Pseudomonadota bacterium]|nr:hypothetical protein [Pseudomonadota bacterium]